MKKVTSRVIRTIAALSAVMVMSVPMVAQPSAQIFNEVAYAASAPVTVAELTYDIGSHPEKFFTVSTQKNEDGCYTIYAFSKNGVGDYAKTLGDKYKNVKLTSLTVPATIQGKRITRIETAARYAGAISDPDLTSITLSNGILGLECRAISHCDNLKTITLPASFAKFDGCCVEQCPKLEKFITNSEISNIAEGFISYCPMMHEAWSERSAYLMITKGVDITKINGQPIITDIGADKKPRMSSLLESALKNNYAKLDSYNFGKSELLDTYLTIYSRYMLKTKIGITNSMSFNEKVRRISRYVNNTVPYDNEAFSWVYDSKGRLTGCKQKNVPESSSSGAIFFYGKAVCEGYAQGLKYLFREAGITSYKAQSIVTANYVNGTSEKIGHAYNIVYNNGMYFIVDLTCGNYDYLMNPTEHKRFHNTNATSEWNFYDFNDNLVSGNTKSVICNNFYALGDLNRDGKIDRNDGTLFNNYVKGTTAQKRSIANNCGLTVSMFANLADVSCDGQVVSSQDGPLFKDLATFYGMTY